MQIGTYNNIKNCVIFKPDEFKELQQKIKAQRQLINELSKEMNL